MLKYYKFGPAVMALRDFWNNQFGNFWTWKLDPYRITKPKSGKADITVEGGEYLEKEKAAELLYCEKDGFFDRQVLKAFDGGTIMRLINRSGGDILLQYHISADYRNIKILQDTTESAGQAAFELLSRTVIYAMLNRAVITFHGVLIEQSGKGVIISAPSGTGKTVHARLWRDNKNALIINGDNACCCQKDGRFIGFGIPWSGTSGEAVNREVPIQALVILERGEENRAERLNAFETFGAALPMLHCPTWDAHYSETALDLLDDFLKKIPVFRLYCRPDKEAVDTLAGALEELKQ